MQHEMITHWARAKLDIPETAKKISVQQETEYGGYCETCSYEEQVWVVYVDGKKFHTFSDDLASLLTQVLDYAAANMNGAK